MAIIRDKAGHMAFRLSDDIVVYIADRLTSNIRQIEGVVKKLSAYNGMGETIDRQLVEKAIADVARSEGYDLVIDVAALQGVVYKNEMLDLSSKVIDRYNENR